MCVCVRAWSCSTLCNPLDCSPPASSVRGISQARILEWAAISSSRGIFPTLGLNPCLLHWQAGSLPLCHQGIPGLCTNRRTAPAFASVGLHECLQYSPLLFYFPPRLRSAPCLLSARHGFRWGWTGQRPQCSPAVTTAPGPQPLCLRFLSSEPEGTALHSEDSSSSESMTLGMSGSIPWVQCVRASCESLLCVHERVPEHPAPCSRLTSSFLVRHLGAQGAAVCAKDPPTEHGSGCGLPGQPEQAGSKHADPVRQSLNSPICKGVEEPILED